MPKATVIKGFRRNEKDLQPGDQFECSDAEFAKWAGLGFIRAYETKVTEPVKTKKSSAASRPAPASRKKTSKRRTKKSK